MNKFLDRIGLTTLLDYLINEIFATGTEVNQVDTNTKTYVTEIDYSLIAFDTGEIITSQKLPINTSALGEAGLGRIYLGL